MGDVVGLHDRQTEALARREFPHLSDAHAFVGNRTDDEILTLAARCFHDDEVLAEDEVLLILAWLRVRFAKNEEHCHGL